MKPKFIIATGGTGGHIFSALSLEKELVKNGYSCLIIADNRFLKFKQKFRDSLEYAIIPSSSSSSNPFQFLVFIIKILLGTFIAMTLILKHKPKMVISFGGYPSFPTMLAATILGIPLMVHEQNSVLGRANKFFIKRAQIISLAFPNTGGLKDIPQYKIHVVGNPVDDEITKIHKRPYSLPKNGQKFNILVIGGSQGARILSKVLPNAMIQLNTHIKKHLKITQQSREEDLEEVKNAYNKSKIDANLAPFFNDMPHELSKCHLVIARAGASTISELTASGRPSILIPIEISHENHQFWNAKFLENNGAAWIMEEKTLSSEILAEKLTYLLSNPDCLKEASKKAKSLFIDSTKNMLQLVERFLSTNERQ